LFKGNELMRNIVIAIAITATFSLSPTLANGEAPKPVVTAATPTPASSTPVDPDQKIKCRKVEITGSLVKKPKVCKTVAEWKKIDAIGNRNARAIVESGNTCSGGDLCSGG
jgi:hypothetical protein